MDPSVKKQKTILVTTLCPVYKVAFTHVEKGICDLLLSAFFFAMRSCEYCSVQGECRTKLKKIQNIRFYTNNWLLCHTDPNLNLAG
jgi:hypothetical protein